MEKEGIINVEQIMIMGGVGMTDNTLRSLRYLNT